MVVISSVFVVFHVTYPENPATIQLHIHPKNVKPQQYNIFQHQTYNQPKLGLNQTSFTPSGNTSMILEGYVHSTDGQVLGNGQLGIAVMDAFTMATTNSQGYYQVKILMSGQGTFAFKMFQYNTTLYQIYVGQGMTQQWRNVTFGPQLKYDISGNTVSHGSTVPGVSLLFKGFWGQYQSQSDLNGHYTLTMVNGNYSILATKQGFAGPTDPSSISVANSNMANYNISLNQTTTPIFYMSGYVFNELHTPIKGAQVSVIPAITRTEINTTNGEGFYNISVSYYLNEIGVSASGYAPLSQGVLVLTNLTDENFTLFSQNPFNNPGNSGRTGTGYPPNLSGNSSNINYTAQSNITITGKVLLNNTDMPVANQNFTLYIGVNGTYFYDRITTNDTGGYNITLHYPGQYNISVISTDYNQTYLNLSVNHSISGQQINVTAKPGNTYSVSGSVFNKIDNQTLSGATINITSPTGTVLETIYTNSTGNFSFTAPKGDYIINVTYPGYGSVNYPISLDQNITNLNLSLNPTTSVIPGSNGWSPGSGSGLPGASSSNITSQLNGDGGGPGGGSTVLGGSASLDLEMVNSTSGNPIPYTAYMLYVEVNGIYLRINGTTNGTGISPLSLNYSGTFSMLPEMIQYTGNAKLVNTSAQNGPVVFEMNPLPLYPVKIDLYNTQGSYPPGSEVPLSGLSSSSYILPLNYSSEYGGSDYLMANYSLPNGTYNFSYQDSHYVPIYFSASVKNGGQDITRGLNPYVLFLTWSSPVTWSYSISGTTISGGINSESSGSGTIPVALTQGTFQFTGYIDDQIANQTTFSLNTKNYESNLTFDVSGNSAVVHFSSIQGPQSGTYFTVYLNYTLNSTSNIFIQSYDLNVSSINTASLFINGKDMNGSSSGGYFTLSKYFASGRTTGTQISLVANYLSGLQEEQLNNNYVARNITVQYYTTYLG